MQFEFTTPPKHRAPRSSYNALFTALQARPGEWVRLDPDTLGRSPARQASAILNAAALRGLRIQTSKQDGLLYARIIRKESSSGN
jgi:hypothetical protein